MAARDLELAIARLPPGPRIHQTRGDSVEVRGSLYRIRPGCEEDIRAAALHVIDGGFYVIQLLALVAPHEEHTGLDSVAPAKSHRVTDLLDGNTALHGIENALRTALGADPDAHASELGENRCDRFIDPVGPRNAFERNPQTAAIHLRRVFADPPMMD